MAVHGGIWVQIGYMGVYAVYAVVSILEQEGAEAKEAKKKGVSSLFSGKGVRQCYGPLRRFLIPDEHSRKATDPCGRAP